MKFNKKIQIKKNSMFSQILLNSSLQVIFLLSVIFILYTIYNIYINYGLMDPYDYEQIYLDFKNYGQEEAIKRNSLPPETILEILTKDMPYSKNPIYSYYDMEDDREIIYRDTIEYPPESSDDLLMVHLPSTFEEGITLKLQFIILSIFIFILLALIVIYAHVTSSKIISPLQKIIKNVSIISKGNYAHLIEEDIKNLELRNLKDEINNMIKKIHEEMSLKEKIENNRKRLILDISHDLKTPLTNILGYTETLNNYKNLDDDSINKYLKIIDRYGQRANKLIVDLFTFSQMDSPEYKMLLQEIDINEFLRNTISEYISELDENNMRYEINILEKKSLFRINPPLLERALSNLISNSIKYSGENTTLSISTEENDNIFKIIIRDTGTGIDKEYHDTIFDPFIRTDASRSSDSGGSGLGLSITKKIIEKHGWKIYLDKNIDKGCKFIIEIEIKKLN